MIEPLIESCENEDVKKTLRRKWMVNDQGSNIRKALRLMGPDAIAEYNCVDHIIHNMMLDAFKNCPGMLAVLEKCKEMAAYTNRSGKAKKILKKQNKLLGKIFYTLK